MRTLVFPESGSIIVGGQDDGPGFIITKDGLVPIPPWDPNVLTGLSAVYALLTHQAAIGQDDQLDRATELLAPLSEAMAKKFGIEDGTITYVDDDGGGFTCGTPGPRRPVRFPPPGPQPGAAWPGRRLLDDQQLERLNEGDPALKVDASTSVFLQQALAAGVGGRELVEDPAGVAQRLGIDLAEEDLRRLGNLPAVDREPDAIDLELARVAQFVVTDGRYIKEFALKPTAVSKELGLKLSDEAAQRLEELQLPRLVDLRRPGAGRGGEAMNPVAVAVAVGIVIMLVDRPVDIVFDHSGIEKI